MKKLRNNKILTGFELFDDFLRINPIDGTVLVKIPAGEFSAGGDPGESRAERVSRRYRYRESDDLTLSECNTKKVFSVMLPEYYIALHPVTNAQYRMFIEAAGYTEPANDSWKNPLLSEHPAAGVSWYDAQAYCEWSGLRLPSELEWEKAARGIDGRKYPWGNDLDETKFRHRRNRGTEQVSGVWNYAAGCSPYGLYQCSGNAWEWCEDYWEAGAYKRYEKGDFAPPLENEKCSLRGGSWNFNPVNCRVADRRRGTPCNGYDSRGFRLAQSGKLP